MSGERTYPILPCPDLDAAVDFYEALGFTRTYRQLRPNPYAVVARDEIVIHLAGIAGFDPATCVCSVIVVVPDVGTVHAEMAAGLRARYGRLPSTGVPRILRPRRKQGTTTGFSVVDVGGSWLRFYAGGSGGADSGGEEVAGSGLARSVEVAARQGDARGDDAQALAVLDRGLARFPDAPPAERVHALAYRAELLVRTGDLAAARAAVAEAAEEADRATGVVDAEREAIDDDLRHAREVLAAAGPGTDVGGPQPGDGPVA